MVVLLAKTLDVATDTGHMLTQGFFLLQRARLGCRVFFVRGERHFGVDDDVLVIRKIHHHIGFDGCSVLIRGGGLRAIREPLFQPTGFQDAFENQLAPVALGLGFALQRACEAVGFFGDRLVQLAQHADLFHEGGMRGERLLLAGFDLVLELLETLSKGA